jgi:hypothetical protein
VLLLALAKGDSEMAFRALERASIFGMRIEGVFNVEALTNLYSKNPRVRQSAESRLDNMLDGFIPARGIRRAIETIIDPGLVRGPLKNVPFFSQDGFPVIDPTTGEQRQAVVNILGSLRPDLGIPLLPRETNEVESEITRLRQFGAEGVGRRRPQLGARQEEALKRDGINPKSFTHRRTIEKFERLSGQIFFKEAVKLINDPVYPSLTLEIKAQFINSLSARANRHARIMILGDMGLQPEPKAYTQTDAILRMLSGEDSILRE